MTAHAHQLPLDQAIADAGDDADEGEEADVFENLTPVSEEAAKVVARSNRPAPVHQWELPQPKLEAKVCPGCSKTVTAPGGHCSYCDEPHPCECMEQAAREDAAARRSYEFDGDQEDDD